MGPKGTPETLYDDEYVGYTQRVESADGLDREGKSEILKAIL
jgi:hypothetical protein